MFNSNQIEAITDGLRELWRQDMRAIMLEFVPLLKSEPPQEDGKSLSREETRVKLGCSFPTLRQLEKTGKLKPFRIGRSVKYRSADVANYMAGREV